MGLTQCDGVEGLFMLERDNKKIYIAYTSTIYSLWLPLISYSMNSWMTWRPNSVSIILGDSGILGWISEEWLWLWTPQNKFVKRLIEAFPTEILKVLIFHELQIIVSRTVNIKSLMIKQENLQRTRRTFNIPDEYIYEEIDSPVWTKNIMIYIGASWGCCYG